MRIAKTHVIWMVLAGVLVLAGGCGKTETFNATISYVLEPTQGVPEGLTTLAILDAGVETLTSLLEETGA